MFHTLVNATLFNRRLSRRGPDLRAMLAWQQQRQALARLDPHLLADIGLTAAEAREEADRPIWDAPSWWRPGGAATRDRCFDA